MANGEVVAISTSAVMLTVALLVRKGGQVLGGHGGVSCRAAALRTEAQKGVQNVDHLLHRMTLHQHLTVLLKVRLREIVQSFERLHDTVLQAEGIGLPTTFTAAS